MAARLSGRPAPKKKGKEEQEGGEEETQKQTKKQKEAKYFPFLVAIAVISLLLALLATGGMVYFVMSGGAMKNAAPHAIEEEKAFVMGPTVDLGDFTVNLGDVDQRRFLRTSLTLHLEMAVHDKKKGGGEHGGGESKVPEEIKVKIPLFKDLIIRTLSDKTAKQLEDSRGKDQLEGEMIAKLNDYMTKDIHVKDIYFTEFIIQ